MLHKLNYGKRKIGKILVHDHELLYFLGVMSKMIGISDIQVYLPEPTLKLETLMEGRVKEVPKLERHLERARRVTGQRALRFPAAGEDSATMAAAAAYRLLRYRSEEQLKGTRYLATGTESGVDHSKPISAYVQGMLRQAGVAIPSSLSSFQMQHACAAGTLALSSVGSLLMNTAHSGESGVVLCTDIARYKTHTTAEVTQGAGAVALLVEPEPNLIELDLDTQGYYSRDVDDFFRPLGSHTAEVKGSYSMECYIESLEQALLDHCERSGKTIVDALTDTDYFVLHTPFRNLPETAMTALLEKHLGMDREGAHTFLAHKGLFDGVNTIAEVGNIYTGATYLALASLLSRQYAAIGDGVVGKSVLLASYGSGNTMVVLSGRIAPAAPEVVSNWNLDRLVRGGRTATFEEYRSWAEATEPLSEVALSQPPCREAPLFALTEIRKDGYRQYSFNPLGAAPEAAETGTEEARAEQTPARAQAREQTVAEHVGAESGARIREPIGAAT